MNDRKGFSQHYHPNGQDNAVSSQQLVRNGARRERVEMQGMSLLLMSMPSL